MIPFFNIPNLSEIFFPKAIKASYDIRREQAIGNRDYRNSFLSLPLELSLKNLRQIEGRVFSRINKEKESGNSTTNISEKYDTADQAINRAEVAINIATSTSSTGFGIHPLYINARFALEEAKYALTAVVDMIPETK